MAEKLLHRCPTQGQTENLTVKWQSHINCSLTLNFLRENVGFCRVCCQVFSFLHVFIVRPHSWPLYICQFESRHLQDLTEEICSSRFCTNSGLSYSLSQHSPVRIYSLEKCCMLLLFKSYFSVTVMKSLEEGTMNKQI